MTQNGDQTIKKGTKMKLQEFLNELTKTGWDIYEHGDVTNNGGAVCAFGEGILRRKYNICECPIAYVANRKMRKRRFNDGDTVKAAKYLGLDRRTANHIVKASDNVGYPQLRKRLLKACNLSETTNN